MKAVLISIQPKWCELIASGKKTVEVRKTGPELIVPFKSYIYQTKKRWTYDIYSRIANSQQKVIGEFVCNKVEQGHILWVKEHPEYYDKVDEKTQLTYRQMFDYLGDEGIGWFWHISNLVIYDEPKELSEFSKPYGTIRKAFESQFITRPPQSWCFVEELVGDNK